MRSSVGPLVLACLLLGACNEGGIMELELRLPPAPSSFDLGPCGAGDTCADGVCETGRCIYRGEWYSQVEITSEFDFVDPSSGEVNQWDLGLPARVDEVPLPPAGEDRWSCTSVLGDRAVETVRVRLRYCRDIPCVESLTRDTVEHWYEIERPFYDGKRTYVRRHAPVVSPEVTFCETDDECTTALEGPECVGSARCGCTSDVQCPDGHCEGAGLPAGEGRCTIDVERCRVAGCIVSDRLLDAPNLCLDLDTPNPRHPCEEQDSEEYGGAACYVP